MKSFAVTLLAVMLTMCGAAAEQDADRWAPFSYDKARKLIVLCQFHAEGFVNTYRQVANDGSAALVFESEAFENFNNSWKARESYESLSNHEFIETFELAAPGKPFQTCSRNHFKRVGK